MNTDKTRKARYRFEQTNIMSFKDIPVSHFTVRGQYLFEVTKDEVLSQWEESHYSFSHQQTDTEDFLSLSDKIRGKVRLKIDKFGQIIEILNPAELKQSWETAKQLELPKSKFFNKLQQVKKAGADEIINAGDEEFSDMNIFKQTLVTYLYFKVLLGQYLQVPIEQLENEVLTTYSYFFQEIPIEINLIYSKPKISETQITINQYGELNKDKIDTFEMIRQYNEKYKPRVHYNFSEYEYDYNKTLVLNKQDGLLDSADVRIEERIKNNISFEVIFSLKRVEL